MANIVKDIGIYLFDNAVIPVMLFLDDNFGIFTDLKDKMDSKDKVKPNTKLNEMTYDCEHDLIKIKYYFDNKEYVLCINRMNPIIVKEIINKELKNSNLPEEIRIGAVLRDDKVIIPRSNFVFQKDDKVVFLVKKESISVVENIFRISSI